MTDRVQFPPAHPDDILVVAVLRDAAEYPWFEPRQVISTNAIERLRGRKIRRAWLAPTSHEGARFVPFMVELTRVIRMFGGEIHHLDTYGNWLEHDKAVAEQAALAELEQVVSDTVTEIAKQTGVPRVLLADDL
ncbi:hypothetical protein [Actinoplanes sp. NPDC026670]|uniref:hypothetical protein n=1 Tax=Actinoplanes sp. NPDC026670 TaxID=3154700 RepID=UPI00340727D1